MDATTANKDAPPHASTGSAGAAATEADPDSKGHKDISSNMQQKLLNTPARHDYQEMKLTRRAHLACVERAHQRCIPGMGCTAERLQEQWLKQPLYCATAALAATQC